MRNLIFYGSYYEAIKELPASEQGKVYKAVIDYAMDQIEPDLTGVAKAIFVLIRPTLDASIKNYENGKKGGRPKSEKESQGETNSKTETGTQTKTQLKTQKETESTTEPQRENEKENENDMENDIQEKESVKEKAGQARNAHTEKHKYGKFNNVLLTAEEYERLLSEPDGQSAIEYFSEYREMKGYKCKNDNLAIRNWAFDAVKERRQRANKEQQMTMNSQPTKQKVSDEEAKAWK